MIPNESREVPPSAAWERIDQLCLEFEDAWTAGQAPRAEEWLARTEPDLQPHLLRELLQVEIACRRHQGEAPDATEYHDRLPAWSGMVESAFAPNHPAHHGDRLGRYRLLQLLAEGAFGAVFLARDEQLHRDVAIKIARGAAFAARYDADRWIREARTLACLNHPSIVPIHDVGEAADGSLYLVMPWLEGGTLADRIHHARLPTADAIRVAAGIADAVEYAHRQGIIHRDLKPSNVLMKEDGQACVTDFGLAVQRQAPHDGAAAGTLHYMAPEQLAADASVSPASDIWGLGVILYEMLTGHLPFTAGDRKSVVERITHSDPVAPHVLQPSVPRWLSRACLRCLRKEPTRRWQSAGELATALRAAHTNETPHVAGHLIGVLLFVAMLLALGRWFPQRNAMAARSTMTGKVDVVLLDASEDRGGLSVDHSGALPLRAGDRIRIQVEVNIPSHLYLVWIDTGGQAIPIYPWTGGDWHSLPQVASPKLRLSLPHRPDDGWVMQPGPAGIESVVLMARRTPLPPDARIATCFADLNRQPWDSPVSVYRFQDELQSGTPNSRTPDFEHPDRLDHPVLTNHALLHDRLEEHFDFFEVVSFASAGN